jgi:hypothetical protein
VPERYTVDFRAVYAQVLQLHWGFTPAQTQAVYGNDFRNTFGNAPTSFVLA